LILPGNNAGPKWATRGWYSYGEDSKFTMTFTGTEKTNGPHRNTLIHLRNTLMAEIKKTLVKQDMPTLVPRTHGSTTLVI